MTGRGLEFEWDDQKSNACFEDRGFDFHYAAQIFTGVILEKVDNRKDYGEPRIQAAGLIDGAPFMVVYTLRNGCIRIISARKMHRKEWAKWQE